jgi:hypothetical protein
LLCTRGYSHRLIAVIEALIGLTKTCWIMWRLVHICSSLSYSVITVRKRSIDPWTKFSCSIIERKKREDQKKKPLGSRCRGAPLAKYATRRRTFLAKHNVSSAAGPALRCPTAINPTSHRSISGPSPRTTTTPPRAHDHDGMAAPLGSHLRKDLIGHGRHWIEHDRAGRWRAA